MAIVINKSNVNKNLVAKNGDSCMVRPGKSKVEDKFCSNLPPDVQLVSLDKPAVKKVQVKAKETKKAEKKEKTSKENKE